MLALLLGAIFWLRHSQRDDVAHGNGLVEWQLGPVAFVVLISQRGEHGRGHANFLNARA
jgi:hypothetical protein